MSTQRKLRILLEMVESEKIEHSHGASYVCGKCGCRSCSGCVGEDDPQCSHCGNLLDNTSGPFPEEER